MTARTFLALFTASSGAIAFAACSSDPSNPAVTVIHEEAGASDADVSQDSAPAPEAGPSGPWTTTACGTCTVAQCKNRRDACDGDPSCSAHATCVDACPPSANGTPDEACLEACPLSDGVAAAKLRAAFDTCVRGSAEACPACKVPPPSAVDVLAQTCGGSTETNECFKCEDLSCCQTFQECVDEPECKQQLQPCLVGCKDQPDYDACKAACYEAHPKGVKGWARRQTCLLARCGVACNSGAPLDPCVECTTVTKCRDATARCTADQDCFLLDACVTSCQVKDDACIAGCKAKFSNQAGALFDAFLACAVTSCLDVCG